MFYINLEINIPDHNGISANLIYEFPEMVGISQSKDNTVRLCSTKGITLPYVAAAGCYLNNEEIKRVYIEPLDGIHCISENLADFSSLIGSSGESFEIIGASAPLPGMKCIEPYGVYANPNQVYKANIENGAAIALLKRELLSSGFRFKAIDKWYGIVNDITVLDRQPSQLFSQDRVYGFIINGDNPLLPINEVGTIY